MTDNLERDAAFHTFARVMFALGMISLGVLGFIYDDFAMNWQPVAASLPGRPLFAYIAAAMEVVFGVGLLTRRAAALSSRLLFLFMVLWILSLEVPRAIVAPLIEARWNAIGEISVIVAGAWSLFAGLNPQSRFAASSRGFAPYLFGFALPPIGLSHFFYTTVAVNLVPAYLPFRLGWAYLAGAGHIAAGLGVLFRVVPRLAAIMEAGMITAFTILVTIPPVLADPTKHFNWAALFSSFLIGNGAWAVASYIPASHGAGLFSYGRTSTSQAALRSKVAPSPEAD